MDADGAPPNAKRPRHDESPSSIQNPNPLPISSQSHFDLSISSLLSFPDSSPSPSSIGRSFDRALEKALASASSHVSAQDLLLDRTVELASLLLESTQRCYRKRATVHNSNSWPFPQDLTIKVFSMLDKKCLMQAMVSCTMFQRCAIDPLCYSRIGLKDKNVDDGVVRTLIHRAGKELRSLELGHVARPTSPLSLLTGSCLSPLSYNHCFIGNRLRSLHLYGFKDMYKDSYCDALSACSNLTDLKIVGLTSEQIFEPIVTRKSCRKIEHLFLEARLFPYSSTGDSVMADFVASLPNLTSLTFIGFDMTDAIAQLLFEGFPKLKHMNLSRASQIKGRFLRDLGDSLKDSRLETLILRDCPYLEEKEVLQFLNSLFTGNLKLLGHIDVSNTRGLRTDGVRRSKNPNFPLEKLKEERPNVKFVADFTSSLSRSERFSRGISDSSDDEDDGYEIAPVDPRIESDGDDDFANFVDGDALLGYEF
ncbi:unnamed protein product [Microthlaspi erraticum]|uniref:F-box domain-containing protein n=1 Tax=Microthlaspi erraticum TaxID=1685480 RepID=A0A6D2L2J7_9BRAS|nr:unnamed protein product [Microthlaspi erraticum]CAA7053749.1 unnamed protein product [Microthlaspi erraticum]